MALLLSAAGAIAPAHSRADMPDADSLLDYGFKGFTLGVELGLAVGYITTGPKWERNEWRSLVIGMGIGALSGLTTGILMAVIDTTSGGVPGGFYLLRDAGYGALLGGVMGSVIGILFWVNDGSPKDVLRSAAWGGLFGCGAGLIYGMIEASNAKPRRRGYDDDDAALHLGKGIKLSVSPTPPSRTAGGGVAAVLYGPLDF
jgi:hypothetical protein